MPPPVGNYDDLLEEWTSYLETIEVDQHYLLKLPHDKFWAQVRWTNRHSIFLYYYAITNY